MFDSREAIAKHLFTIMNERRFTRGGVDCLTGEYVAPDPDVLDCMWEWYKEQGFHAGYLRLADETVSKGYKP